MDALHCIAKCFDLPRQGGEGMVWVSVTKGSTRRQVEQGELRQTHWPHVGPLSKGEHEKKDTSPKEREHSPKLVKIWSEKSESMIQRP